MKKHILILLLFLFAINNFGQNIWRAEVGPVTENGYYNIELGQDIIGVSQNEGFTDLKIIGNDKEVPYFVRPVNPIKEVSHFESYNLKQSIVKDSLNIIVVNNDRLENINRFYIVARSADVSKYASIRGSNDLRQWYIVKQETSISNLGYTEENRNEILVLDIPEGNYRYYEITLANNQNSPLEILKVGKIKNTSIYGKFTELNLGKFIQQENADKKSHISFPNLLNTYRIDKIEFIINNKTVYFRHTLIKDSVHNQVVHFDLSAKGNNTFFINDFRLSQSSSILIENNNNPPLTIDSIKAYGLNRYLCAYLEKEQTYYLQIGQKDNTQPKYDIAHFQNDIPTDLPIIHTSRFHCEVCPKDEIATQRERILIEKPIFLWGVIIIIGLFLTFICVKMIKEIKKRE